MSPVTDSARKNADTLTGLRIYRWLQNLALKHLPVSFLRNRLAKTPLKTNSPISIDKQLLIDVSVIAKEDAKTGIQRVVRNLYQELLAAPPEGYRICPIAATRKQGYYYLPTDFLRQSPKKLGSPPVTPVTIRAGDLFLGLDLAAHIIPHRLEELLRWKRQGVRMSFFIYDLLPVLEPAWFNPKTTKNFRRWLRALALLADDAIAISRTVQNDFAAWMQNNYNLVIPCATIQLGAELNTHYHNPSATEQVSHLPSQWTEHKFILMVGTIEPRKGHADIVDAFEPLWAANKQTILVIAGKQGWKVESFTQRLKNHPEIGKRLYWLDSPSDEVLVSLYQHCSGLIMASKGEGFGLPLIEAAYFNKPLLVRDIPVFREIAGDTASYFSATGYDNLKQALPQWLMQLDAKDQAPTTYSSWVTWQEVCAQLTKALLTPRLSVGGNGQVLVEAITVQQTSNNCML